MARINPAVLSELNLPLNAEGVAVLDPGANRRSGLRAGDVILIVNGILIERPDDAAAMLSGQVQRIEMVVQRGTRRLTMRFRL